MRNPDHMIDLIRRWATECCDDFGETETGHLYESFASWIVRTRAMRRLPGRVLFGQAMRLAGYEKRVAWLGDGQRTMWTGVVLKPIVPASSEDI